MYFAQTINNGASFIQSVVDSTANHTGVICTQGTACAPGTRNLLDLFEVAIDPPTGKAAIVYVNAGATVVVLPPSMRRCWIEACGNDLRATRDFATAMLLGCGLRRHCDQEDGGATVGLANLFSSIGMDCCICSI